MINDSIGIRDAFIIRVKWFGRHETIIRLKNERRYPHLGKGVLIDSFVRYIPPIYLSLIIKISILILYHGTSLSNV